MVVVLLAEGFEEIEALAVVDILRRGGVEVKMVSIQEEKWVCGAHGIRVEADAAVEADILREAEAVVLPGGGPGTERLKQSTWVEETLHRALEKELYLCAICAAPSVLGKYGYLKGKKAICYDGFENQLIGAEVTDRAVVTDGKIITSKGAGTAHLFAFEILKQLKGEATMQQVKESMKYE